VLINDPEYKRLVLQVCKEMRRNDQVVLKTERDLEKAENNAVKISERISRIADRFAVELEAAACALDLFDANARMLVWIDVEALVNGTNGV
jgi:hypothetical protein